jgi:3,4-dihydroxy 2-butanone 4-phosphate synthase/GTP cyclohydrolase II
MKMRTSDAFPCHQELPMNSLNQLLDVAAAKQIFILVDDTTPFGGGSLVIAGDAVDAETINFMAHHGRGIVCLAVSTQRAVQLGLFLQPRRGPNRPDTAFTLSIEARKGVSTGISAADRALTVATATAAKAGPESIVSPGHVFPVVAKSGGLLQCNGHTEASLDIMRLSGQDSAAVFCRILSDDGELAETDQLVKLAEDFDLRIGRFSEIARHLWSIECQLQCIAQHDVSVTFDEKWMLASYRCNLDSCIRRVLIKGETDLRSHFGSSVVLNTSAKGVRQNFVDEHLSDRTLRDAVSKLADVDHGVVILAPEAPDYFFDCSPSARQGRDSIDTVVWAAILREIGVSYIEEVDDEDIAANRVVRHLSEMSTEYCNPAPELVAAHTSATSRSFADFR